MTGNIYLDLTNEFNAGKLRAILSSGQAVVVHGLALSSKDGDWILKEDAETFEHSLQVLESYGATYRLGAPLDGRWMRGGWSAHLEFIHHGARIRTDFVSRPPRLSSEDLAALWSEQERGEGIQNPVPTIDARRLAELKKTERERDYSFIGEIARLIDSPSEQILLSRSTRDLLLLWPQISHEKQAELLAMRPLLAEIEAGRDALETALDAERRVLSRINEARLAAYGRAAQNWFDAWPQIRAEVATLRLREAHQTLIRYAEKLLPEAPDE